jgi:membrane glycosyltransferase
VRHLGLIEVIFLVSLVLLFIPIWAIVDALLRPDSQWAAADQNKVAWVVALAVTTFLLGPVGVVLAIVYLVSVRPKFRPR